TRRHSRSLYSPLLQPQSTQPSGPLRRLVALGLALWLQWSRLRTPSSTPSFFPQGKCCAWPIIHDIDSGELGLAAGYRCCRNQALRLFDSRRSAVTGSSNRSFRSNRVEKKSTSRFSTSAVLGLIRAMTSSPSSSDSCSRYGGHLSM